MGAEESLSARCGRAIVQVWVLLRRTQENRAVLTLNRRDFMKLHKRSPAHGGIIACTTDADYGRQANRILAEIAALTSLAGI
jgi:hypothetical protein